MNRLLFFSFSVHPRFLFLFFFVYYVTTTLTMFCLFCFKISCPVLDTYSTGQLVLTKLSKDE